MDKSYLQGASRADIERLCCQHHVLMPEVIFMELISSDDLSRARCFQKFPDVKNPVDLIDNVSSLLKYEVKNRKPCTPIYKRRQKITFVFNPKVTDIDLQLTTDQKKAVDDWEKELEDDIEFHKKSCAVVDGWFPELVGYKSGGSEAIIHDAMDEVAKNIARVRSIYSEMRHRSFPDPSVIDRYWAIFCWMQVHLLAAIEYVRKYGVRNQTPLVSLVKIQHDVLDIQYCITGVLAGALATRDKIIASFFRLLCPNGYLIT